MDSHYLIIGIYDSHKQMVYSLSAFYIGTAVCLEICCLQKSSFTFGRHGRQEVFLFWQV